MFKLVLVMLLAVSGWGQVHMKGTVQASTGTPLWPTVTTNPPGLAVQWTNAPQSEVGTYWVTATVVDANYTGSASAWFTILSPAIPPSVTLVSPIAGTVQMNTLQSIQALVVPGSVALAKVDFYVNTSLRCTVAVTPYACVWKVPGGPGKTYQLWAKVYDVAGQSATSIVVTVVSTK